MPIAVETTAQPTRATAILSATATPKSLRHQSQKGSEWRDAMRRFAPVSLLLASTAIAQQSTGPATSKGSCSPANTGNNNTFTITCAGLNPDQAKLLANIPALLNTILQKQKDEMAEILSGLNACAEGVKKASRGI